MLSLGFLLFYYVYDWLVVLFGLLIVLWYCCLPSITFVYDWFCFVGLLIVLRCLILCLFDCFYTWVWCL